MASDTVSRLGRTRLAIGAAVLALCFLAAIAGRVADGAQAARWLVGLVLLSLAPLALLWHALRHLQQTSMPLQTEIPPAMPLHAQALAQSVLQLEAQLQHAPVALFLIREPHAAAMDQTAAQDQANFAVTTLVTSPANSAATSLASSPANPLVQPLNASARWWPAMRWWWQARRSGWSP